MHHLLAGRAAASRARGRPAGDGAEELSASVFQFREEGGNNLARRRHERRAAPPAGRLALVLQQSERPLVGCRPARAPCFSSGRISSPSSARIPPLVAHPTAAVTPGVDGK